MAIDYKKELISAAKTMILVHDLRLLIRIIVRTIVQKVKVTHAGILLFDKGKESFVLTVSRGSKGLRIPEGFARMDNSNPLIRFFTLRLDRKILKDGSLTTREAKRKLKDKKLKPAQKQLLKAAIYQMEIFEAVVCIPSYFHDELLGILLLGEKKNGRDFKNDELDFFAALASDVAMAIRNAQLFNELQQELDKKHHLFIHTTIALAVAIDAKDHYTHGHTSRVTQLSLEIAKKLMKKNRKKFDDKMIEQLHIASLLHDIGKIGIPESILNKDGPLDETEQNRIKEHPIIGATILNPIKELGDAILGVKYHHEKYDGSGYPEGLKGKQIPLLASIIAVADTFDAMTTDRPYRRGLTKEEAISEIKRVSGKQLDPRIAAAFEQIYLEGKI